MPISKNKPPVTVTAPVPAHMRELLGACGWKMIHKSNVPRLASPLAHRARSDREAIRVRGYKLASQELPHPTSPHGERERAEFAARQ